VRNTSDDVWEVLSTARTIRRFTDEPVDDAVLTRCLQAATWAPSGANAQAWRFVLLRNAVGVPDDWMLAGHVVVGWPRGNHGPLRRRPLEDVVLLDRWDQPAH